MSGLLPLRAAVRELWGMRWRTIAVMLILGAGFGMFAGVYSAIDSLFAFRDSLYQHADIAGHELRFTPEDSANLPHWADISGVRAVEPRLMLPGNIVLANGRPLSSLMVAVQGQQRVNRLLLIEGHALDDAKPLEVVIDRNLARHYGYKPGDKLRLNIGKDHFNLTVRGVAISAEHLVDGANPNFFLPSKGSLGIVFASHTLMKQRLGFDLVNSVLFTGNITATDLMATTTEEILRRAGRKLTVEESLPLTRQFGHMFLNVDLGAFRIFTPAIVAIFAACAITILFFLLHQWVTRQHQQLGVLASLGYGRRAIVLRIFAPVGLIVTGGLASGIGVSFIMLYGFGMEYANAIGLPAPALMLFVPHLAWAVFGLIMACVIGAGLPLLRALNIMPISAVRNVPQVPPSGHGTLAARCKSPVWRYALQAILRRRYASLMTVVAVALALSPALAYFIALRSFEDAIVNSFSKDRWEYAIDFLSPVWDDELDSLRKMPGVTAIDPFVRGPARFTAGDKRESGLLIGVSPASSLRLPGILEGRMLQSEDVNAVVMERRLARSLAVHVGDSLTVEGRRPVQTTLVGTFSGALPGETFAVLPSARQWLDLDEQNTGMLVAAYSSSDLTVPFYQDSRVGKVTARAALVGEVIAHLQEIAGIVYLAAAFSVGVALLFLFTSSSFAFMERESDFVLLEILGFRVDTVSAIVWREVGVLGSMGIALALPLGYVLAVWLNNLLGQAWFYVPTVLNWRDPLFIAAPALILLPFTTLPVLKRIRVTTMTDVLRRRSFG